ncbi:MAG: hypothetical protein K2X87_18285 [Gemmataceae bacterium]|nr:hypothetical protein [Gemmataceae bacterium]
MPHVPAIFRAGGPLGLFLALATSASGQEPVTLAESFRPGHSYTVEVRVKLDGKLAVPTGKDKPPQMVPLNGASRVVYDERILDPDEAIRQYREVEFRRVLGSATQDAGIRPAVRRMVVIRAGDRRAPFSPDGPLTWGEIDVVRTDVFVPATIPGLLPPNAVKPGQSWKASTAAVTELTDLETIDDGGVAVELAGVTTVDNRRVARLRVFGTIRGVNQDGPNRQKLDGTAYFDLDAGLLTYLSVRGTHELLDGQTGHTVGVIDGQFTMTRRPLAQPPAGLSDAGLRGVGLKPDAENTLLLYDDPNLGVRFLYPRGWKVGAVQGRQVTLDHTRLGGGILVTVEPAGKVPAAEDYLREVTAFLQKEKAQVAVLATPARVRAEPAALDRFALAATFDKDAARMEYGVLRQADGGATVAARLPQGSAADLRPEADRIIRSLTITKRIAAR